MLRFEEAELREQLSNLTADARTTFAAACATRQQGSLNEHEFADIAGLLHDLWAHLGGDRRPDPELLRLAEAAESRVPDSEHADDWAPSMALAENAIAALAYALSCAATGDAQAAAWSARQAIELLDFEISQRFTVEAYNPSSEEAITSHPAMQTELARQIRDLDELRISGSPSQATVRALRERAYDEAASFHYSE